MKACSLSIFPALGQLPNKVKDHRNRSTREETESNQGRENDTNITKN